MAGRIILQLCDEVLRAQAQGASRIRVSTKDSPPLKDDDDADSLNGATGGGSSSGAIETRLYDLGKTTRKHRYRVTGTVLATSSLLFIAAQTMGYLQSFGTSVSGLPSGLALAWGPISQLFAPLMLLALQAHHYPRPYTHHYPRPYPRPYTHHHPRAHLVLRAVWTPCVLLTCSGTWHTHLSSKFASRARTTQRSAVHVHANLTPTCSALRCAGLCARAM